MREENALVDDAALDAIEKRAAAATPGPWHHSQNRAGGARVDAPTIGIADVLSRAGVAHPVQTSCTANAAFIAAARSDVPALVTAVREARRAAELVAAGHAVRVGATTVVVVCAGDEFLPAAHEVAKVVKERDEANSTIAWLRQTNQDIADERLELEDLLAALLLDLQVGRVPSEALIARVRKAVDDA